MDRNKMGKLFEDILADPEAATNIPDTSALRSVLFDALAKGGASDSVREGDAEVEIANYLDDALDPGEKDAFIEAFLKTPEEIFELQSAQGFLDAVADNQTEAPADLVAAAVSKANWKSFKARDSVAKRPIFANFGRQWAWAGGAVASIGFAVLIVRNVDVDPVTTIPQRPDPVASTASEAPQAAPEMLAQVEPPAPALPLAVAEPEVSAPVSPPPPPAAQPEARTRDEADEALARPAAAPAPSGATEIMITGSIIANTQAVGVPITAVGEEQFLEQGAIAVAEPNTELYPDATPNPVKITAREPVSTFSVDVDTASYANLRRYLNAGSIPPSDAVRVEEMINYFDYTYEGAADPDAPFQSTVVVHPTPWNADTEIMHVGIQGYDIPRNERPPANLVFLIDTSGSMNAENKLPLLKRSFRLLVDQLGPEDRVSIVAYAGAVGTILEPTPGSDRARIFAALDRLHSAGSTAGAAGIRQAYQLAKLNFDEDSVNRVILATDGDFNVGIVNPDALEDYVAEERSSGIFMTVLGFGEGNYNDLMMQQLAQAGNGNAAYIDTLNEARKVFVDQISGTLFTIAKDVKIQVEFNPARVAEYRLIGYETRILNETDFNNDAVDAGDIGAGHTVTALYEITPVGSDAQLADPLRYAAAATAETDSDEFAFVKIRYKLPDEDESRLIERAVTDADVVAELEDVPEDFRFATAVAGAGQLIRNDPYLGGFGYADAIALANASRGEDPFGYRTEFVQLLRMAQALSAPVTPEQGTDEQTP